MNLNDYELVDECLAGCLTDEEIQEVCQRLNASDAHEEWRVTPLLFQDRGGDFRILYWEGSWKIAQGFLDPCDDIPSQARYVRAKR